MSSLAPNSPDPGRINDAIADIEPAARLLVSPRARAYASEWALFDAGIRRTMPRIPEGLDPVWAEHIRQIVRES